MQKTAPAFRAIEMQARRLEYAHHGCPGVWQKEGSTTHAYLHVWLAVPHGYSLCCLQRKSKSGKLGKAVMRPCPFSKAPFWIIHGMYLKRQNLKAAGNSEVMPTVSGLRILRGF